MKRRLKLMDTLTAKDSLIAKYVEILNQGIPRGTLPPFKRWVKVLAESTNTDSEVLMEDIRAVAMQRVKEQTRHHPC